MRSFAFIFSVLLPFLKIKLLVKKLFTDSYGHVSFIISIINPSHAAIKISINATAAEFICKNIFPTPMQVKKIIKNKIGDIQQIYLYRNVCK